ncbi:MAG: BrnA antitoxin family protein [Terriglobia bacterium]
MSRRSSPKPLPAFASEAEEREFWETHDTTPYFDREQARSAVFPNLKPSTETISLRLPTALLSQLKELANKRDVPYQSLLKVFLAERVAREAANVRVSPTRKLRTTSSREDRLSKPKTSRARRG